MEKYGHHRNQALMESTYALAQKDAPRDFIGGNMFVYYSRRQRRRGGRRIPRFRGPDLFVVKNVPPGPRDAWFAWQEEGRLPDVVVEFLSPSTERFDLTEKKRIYEQEMRVPEYFWYDQDTGELGGFRLEHGTYGPLPVDEGSRLWSEELGLFLVRWEGEYDGEHRLWLRWAGPDGMLLPTTGELAEQERGRAEQERERAEQERQRAEQERQRAEQEHRRAEQQRERAEQERARAAAADQRAMQAESQAEAERAEAAEQRWLAEAERGRTEAARRRLELLSARLRELGIDPREVIGGD
jgi:Uma2 family endonuclease